MNWRKHKYQSNTLLNDIRRMLTLVQFFWDILDVNVSILATLLTYCILKDQRFGHVYCYSMALCSMVDCFASHLYFLFPVFNSKHTEIIKICLTGILTGIYWMSRNEATRGTTPRTIFSLARHTAQNKLNVFGCKSSKALAACIT
jgi:hypothetical protein